MRVIWNLLFGSACAIMPGNGTDTAHAQDTSEFVVDGDWGDWGGGGPAEGDEFYDVVPDTNSSIDIITYGYGLGSFRRDDANGTEKLFAFIFRFLEDPFQDSAQTSVELFFDVSADSTLGEATPPWVGFLPDHRIEIVGRNGGLTKEVYRRLVGDQWVVTEADDLDEVEVALSGQWLEGAIPWSALGNPGDTLEDEERGYSHFKWTAKTTKNGSHDFVPDGDTYYEVPWGPVEVRISTVVEPRLWGSIKSDQANGELE